MYHNTHQAVVQLYGVRGANTTESNVERWKEKDKMRKRGKIKGTGGKDSGKKKIKTTTYSLKLFGLVNSHFNNLIRLVPPNDDSGPLVASPVLWSPLSLSHVSMYNINVNVNGTKASQLSLAVSCQNVWYYIINGNGNVQKLCSNVKHQSPCQTDFNSQILGCMGSEICNWYLNALLSEWLTYRTCNME